MTTLILDTREHDLASHLTAIKVPFTIQQLDVGDILIQDAGATPLLVIERKSHADFAASNADGRYREQRARLMAVHGSGVAVLYMLEGVWTETETRMFANGRTSESVLKRLSTRLLLRYGMPVLMSASLQETARWCRILLTQLQDDPTTFQPEGDMATATMSAMTTMTAALSTAKKGNRTSHGIAAAMLSAMPGLGGKKVIELLRHRSIAELALLTPAQIGDISVGGKRLGASIGETVYAALHYTAGSTPA